MNAPQARRTGARRLITTAWICALLLLLGGVGLGLRGETTHRWSAERQAQVQAETVAASLGGALAFDDTQAAREYLASLRANPGIAYAVAFDDEGRRFAAYAPSDVDTGAASPRPFAARHSGGAVEIAVPVAQGPVRLGSLYLRTAREPVSDLLVRHSPLALLLGMALIMVALVSRTGAQLEVRARELAQANADLDEANRRLQAEIAERERVESALRQSQKMEALGQLTGGLAHDFNNLLQVVQASLDLVIRRSSDAVRVEKWARAAQQAAERGANLTRQLLAFSRTQKMEVRAFVVSDLVGDLRDLLSRTVGPGVRIDYDLHDAGASVLSDPTQLELALINLVVNARDAMPEGGRIGIATEIVQVGPGRAGLEPGEYVALRVSDTGKGMPPEVAERAFDPFFTTKGVGQGTGLGLSQVYGVARQAGGEASIESEPGGGTTVTVLLRSAGAPAGKPRDPRPLDAGTPAAAASILVVDDEETVRELLAESLQMLGYEVWTAPDGPAALERIQADAPDLMLLDFAVLGMNGAEVARRARALRPGLPILFSSGHADTAAITAAMGKDAQVLRKPYSLDELARVVAGELDRTARRAHTAGRTPPQS